MENTKKYIETAQKESGDMGYISFKDGVAHTLKVLKDKEDTMPDKYNAGGGTVKGMKYLVEENGVQKTFFTSSLALMSKLVDIPYGEEITIQLKRTNKQTKHNGKSEYFGDWCFAWPWLGLGSLFLGKDSTHSSHCHRKNSQISH